LLVHLCRRGAGNSGGPEKPFYTIVLASLFASQAFQNPVLADEPYQHAMKIAQLAQPLLEFDLSAEGDAPAVTLHQNGASPRAPRLAE